MKPVERVKRAIEFKNPDRIPIQHFFSPEALLIHRQNLTNIFDKYPPDLGPSELKTPSNGKKSDWLFSRELSTIHNAGSTFEKQYLDESILYTDRWGCVRGKGTEGRYVVKSPLENWEALNSYELPEPYPDKAEFEKEKSRIREEKKKTGRYLLGYNPYREYIFGGFCFFQRLYWLRGMQNLMLDIAGDRKELHELTDKVLETVLRTVKQTLKLGVDGIYFADDWGGQNKLLVNPSYFRKVFKPRYQEIFDLVHQKGAHVFFHTCGNTLEIIQDLIEVGVDVINPQIPIMDLDKMSQLTKGNVCILTELDRQQILPHGTPEEVRAHVKAIVKHFGTPEGGIIGRGKIGADVPLDNIEAMFSAFWE